MTPPRPTGWRMREDRAVMKRRCASDCKEDKPKCRRWGESITEGQKKMFHRAEVTEMLSDDNDNTENCDVILKECACTISRGSVWGMIITLMVSVFSYFNLVIHMRSFLLAPWHLSALLFTQRHRRSCSLLPLCLQVESRNLVLLHFFPLVYCHWLLLH